MYVERVRLWWLDSGQSNLLMQKKMASKIWPFISLSTTFLYEKGIYKVLSKRYVQIDIYSLKRVFLGLEIYVVESKVNYLNRLA